jgi:anthranilate phosphoribosyltransferase
MTSQSGSADCLEALGVNINLNPQQVADCINQANIGFLFAPFLHSAMKNVMPVRKELGIRTVFNLLGPLTNPAGAQYQTIGLFDISLVPSIAGVLKQLGTRSAYVFGGQSGLDEVCISSDSNVCYLKSNGDLVEFVFNPEDYGFRKNTLESIKGGTPQVNSDIATAIFNGDITDARRDIVIINAGFAISAVEECGLATGFEKAIELIQDGAGLKAVEHLRAVSNSFL